MKLAFVVQRYGTDIAGGSEAHCRAIAEHLSPNHDISVLTTCARDYVTWANAHPPGETHERGVRVIRFPVARRRRLKRFADLSDDVFAGRPSRELQEQWFQENGPDTPALLDHLRTSGRAYDLVLFWTFRYSPSYFGLPLVADRAVLVPTAEEDRAIDLDVAGEYFQRAAGYLFLTPEERTLVSTRAGRDLRPSAVVGLGIDPAAPPASRAILDRHGLPSDYVLYLGRVDRNKGCDTLLEYFQEFASGVDGPTLILAGPTTMRIPAHARIRALGYVSDELRETLLAHARVLIVPSPYESLSIALLEGWNHAIPALVNARCRVLRGQVMRANGGLFYRSSREFHETLSRLLSRPDEREALGRQGLDYVEREYRWPTVLARVEHLLDEVAASLYVTANFNRTPPSAAPAPGDRHTTHRRLRDLGSFIFVLSHVIHDNRSMNFEFGGAIAWRPTREYIERSRLKAFIDRHGLRDYDELLRRSVTDPDWFWPAVLDDLGIEFYEPYDKVLDTSRGVAWAQWCVGGRMNIVHNCLDKWIGTDVEHRTAIVCEDEPGTVLTRTYGELTREVNRCAAALRALDIVKGDRVALFMPMCPDLVVAFFAVIKIGAMVLPLFSGYGPDAVATRLNDAGAVAMIVADGFWRRGQRVTMKPVADLALATAPSVRHVIVTSRIGEAVSMRAGRDHHWNDLVPPQRDDSPTERTGADDPLMIIYTSGTTGRPKGAVHTHCGFPVKTAQDMVHSFDVHAAERMYWVSDIGWMMGPWELLGMTLLGGTIVTYDGALDHPGPDRLWSIVERHEVNVLGVSPTLIRSLMRHGEAPVRAHALESLRILGSTGEPWNPDPWRWLFDVVGGGRLPIINYSGGTEVSGGLVAGNVLTPLKPAAFAGPPPGIAADVVDEQGRPVRNEVGELVVRAPWIGMTRGFWGDPDRYEQTYWSRFPDTWVHGDWAAIDADGLWYILGRSDDTIKIAGKRLGPAEVESVLVEDSAVVEAAAIGIPDPLKGQALACFCVLRPGLEGDPPLAERLKRLVAERLGKPLRPESIEFVADLPKTRNAKVMRRVIRAAYLGDALGDLSSLENPQSIKAIETLARLRER